MAKLVVAAQWAVSIYRAVQQCSTIQKGDYGHHVRRGKSKRMITRMISKLINTIINKKTAAVVLCVVMLLTGIPVYAQSATEYPSQQSVSIGKLSAVVAATVGGGSGGQALNVLQQALSSGKSASSESGSSLRSFRQISSETVLKTGKGDVTRTESESKDAAVTVKKRIYTGSGIGSCTVYMERITADSSSAGQTLTVFQLGEGQGTIRSYDASDKKWNVSPLSEGTLAYGMYFIRTGSSESIFITPQAYRSHENGMIESVSTSNGSMRISKQNGRFYLTISVPTLSQGMFCDFTALCSDSELVNWSDADQVSKWENYRFTDDNRWCYDGYYYKTPSNYIPSGANYFYKLPAAHITGKMARNKDDAASRAFALTMIDVMKARYNSSGYIPSENGSQWLQNTYRIGTGYFDTRFNTDFALAMINAGENFGVQQLIDDAAVYGMFLISYAAKRHYTVGSGAAEGWLVDDYWIESGSPLRTHVSLNHHTAEAVFLYRLADATGDASYAETAEKMVKGIENTADKWIMDDGNLYYSYGNDGKMITGDYPYLTYNDLSELQNLWTERHGSSNAAVSKLMASKLAWMNKNGITGYNK